MLDFVELEFFFPKGILKWIPKSSKASNDSINANGLNFIRGPNLAT